VALGTTSIRAAAELLGYVPADRLGAEPIIVGVDWREDMSDPRSTVVGSHAALAWLDGSQAVLDPLWEGVEPLRMPVALLAQLVSGAVR